MEAETEGISNMRGEEDTGTDFKMKGRRGQENENETVEDVMNNAKERE